MGDAKQPEESGATVSQRGIEAGRLESEKQAEERKARLEEKKLRQARFDTWMRFAGTVALGVLVTGGIQWYGIRSNTEAKKRADIARTSKEIIERKVQRGQMLIQLTNARENALSDLRARMFDALLRSYFKEPGEAERIAILQLIGLNFRDAVQIKPMFELLDYQFKGPGPDENKRKEARESLRSAARSIIRDQLSQIRQSEDGCVDRLELNLNDSRSGSPDCLPGLKIELLMVEEAKIEVRTNTRDGDFLEATDEVRADWDRFTVTYFDMPMVDYTAATPGGEPLRYSIVLSLADDKAKTARIALAVLPLDAFDPQRAYAFNELLKEFLVSTEEESAEEQQEE